MSKRMLRVSAVILATTTVVLTGAGVTSAFGPSAAPNTRVAAVVKQSSARAVTFKARWTVQIHPNVIRLGKAASRPYSGVQCKKELGLACYSPGQLRQAYNEWPLYKKGITG
ncbi:MAG: hypothetical protein ACLQRM_02920 [Acidimicrobiales bacterium]